MLCGKIFKLTFLLTPLYKLKIGNDFKLLMCWRLDYANMTINVFSLVGRYLYCKYVYGFYFLTNRVSYSNLPCNISISFHVRRMKKFKSIFRLKNLGWLTGTELSVSRKKAQTCTASLNNCIMISKHSDTILVREM